jgi:hypothetical protein
MMKKSNASSMPAIESRHPRPVKTITNITCNFFTGKRYRD